MKAKNLLFRLSALENALDAFSYEELGADEAKDLKRSLDHFRERIEDHLWTDKH